MSTHSSDPLKFPAIPLAVGILSGFLTSEVARLLDPTNPFVGLAFGTGITLMVWLRHKSSFAWIAGALAATAVVAYFTAVWGTLTVTALVARTIGLEKLFGEPVGADTFAVAGFLGALLINLALLLLLSPAKGLRLLGKGAAWACVGAFLGFLGSELSDPSARQLRPSSVVLIELTWEAITIIWLFIPLTLSGSQEWLSLSH